MKLTSHQRQIVRTTLSCVEVRASPGSGKTTTLIQRIKHLVRSGVSADQILVLSFSNNSVDELSDRFQRSFEQKGNSGKKSSNKRKSVASHELPKMQTIHAFARSVVVQAGGGVDVVDSAENAALLKAALRSCRNDACAHKLWGKLSTANRRKRLDLVRELLKDSYRLQQLQMALSVAQASKQDLRDVMTAPQFAESLEHFAPIAIAVQQSFTRVKAAAGKLDFGDMLEQAVAAIEGGARIPCTHVLVDEFQDGSTAQNLLLATLAKRGCQLMVFGDPEQAIYGFAGNSYTPLDQVVEGAVLMPLPESHRLHHQTAALAMAVAGVRAQKIVTKRQGTRPVLVRNSDLTTQTHAVVRDIQRLLGQGVDASRIAVLARTRAFLKPVEQCLMAQGINAARQGIKRDFQHALRVLRLVRLIERHVRDKEPIDPDSVSHVFDKVLLATQPCWKSQVRKLMKAGRSPSLEGRYRACMEIYLSVQGGARAYTEIHRNLNDLRSYCRGHGRAIQMLRAIKQGKPMITTMTIHAAKGREWDYVFVVGVADGQLPIYKCKDSVALAEERRLLYVAITRARQAVRLYYSPVPHPRGGKSFEKPSRLLQPECVLRALR